MTVLSFAVKMRVGTRQRPYDRLRFIKLVFIGDTLRVRVTIKGKRNHKQPDPGVVVEALEVFNQRGETVLACEHLLLVKRRGA
jgi:acyl dehydratase